MKTSAIALLTLIGALGSCVGVVVYRAQCAKALVTVFEIPEPPSVRGTSTLTALYLRQVLFARYFCTVLVKDRIVLSAERGFMD